MTGCNRRAAPGIPDASVKMGLRPARRHARGPEPWPFSHIHTWLPRQSVRSFFELLCSSETKIDVWVKVPFAVIRRICYSGMTRCEPMKRMGIPAVPPAIRRGKAPQGVHAPFSRHAKQVQLECCAVLHWCIAQSTITGHYE